MKTAKKALLIVLCIALTVTASVLGTLAYLTDSTEQITNTFTIGKVDIDLTETGAVNNAKLYENLLPGTKYDKDAKVTVKADSEACYVFLKVIEGTNPTIGQTEEKVFDYKVITTGEKAWTYDVANGVYYRIIDPKPASDVELPILVTDENGKAVTVSVNATNAESEVLAKTPFTLSFQAAAVQKENLSLDDAWTQVSANFNP